MVGGKPRPDAAVTNKNAALMRHVQPSVLGQALVRGDCGKKPGERSITASTEKKALGPPVGVRDKGGTHTIFSCFSEYSFEICAEQLRLWRSEGKTLRQICDLVGRSYDEDMGLDDVVWELVYAWENLE